VGGSHLYLKAFRDPDRGRGDESTQVVDLRPDRKIYN
jgi:hypothetical protein